MKGTSYTFRRAVSAFALAVSVAAIAVPAAGAVGPGSPGVIPSKLGSQDPKDAAAQVLDEPSMHAVHLHPTATNEQFSPGAIVSRFGGTGQEHGAAASGNVQMGSEAPSLPSLVARQLGSQDSRDTAATSLPQSSIAASDLGSPDVRDAVESTRPTTIPSNDGFDWGKGGIEIAVAVCGLLLLIALGIGSRRLHQGGGRLRRA
jgi:hypothetical protein